MLCLAYAICGIARWKLKLETVLKWGKAFIISSNIWICCRLSCTVFDEGMIKIWCLFFEFYINRQIFRRSTKPKMIRKCCNKESFVVLSSVCRCDFQFLFASIWFWVPRQTEVVYTTGVVQPGKWLTFPCWPANVLNFKKPSGEDWFSLHMRFVFCLSEDM